MFTKSMILLVGLTLAASRAYAEDTTETVVTPDTVESHAYTGSVGGTVSARGVRNSANIIVYLARVEGDFIPDSTKPILDQINRVFIPHVMPILTGTTVRFTNGDSLDHNVFSPSEIKPFNIGTWGYGGVRDIVFQDTGVVSLLYNIHKEMSAFIVVLQNPYFALTDEEGAYSIEGIPPGKYTLKTWHENLPENSKVIDIKGSESVTADFHLSL